MIVRILFLLFSLSPIASASEVRHVRVQDGEFSVRGLEEYSHTWKQCAKQGDIWVAMPDLRENLVIINDELVRLEQISQRPDGLIQKATHYYETQTFGPVRLEAEVIDSEGQQVYVAIYRLDAEGYSGFTIRQGVRKEVSGSISSMMLNGATLGLPLAMIREWHQPLATDASMVNFDGTYEVIARKVADDWIRIGDIEVATMHIDVEWKHLESGDIYEPGPEGSGGRYVLVNGVNTEVPQVLSYVTDSYAVEFEPIKCIES